MNHLNTQLARFNMIEQQIRPAEVLDPKVLDVIARMPREDFVPSTYHDLAYADTHIPLGHGQVMMKPIQEARMLQALNIQDHDKALEIGTGSGYVTALLANLAKQVISVEIIPELQQTASQTLERNGVTNVILETGDAAHGWPAEAPYSVIAVTGSMPILAEELKQQLNIGGRLFVILGTAPVMTAALITRESETVWSREDLFETDLPALANVEQPPEFVF
jgi:protein-L-isoaspartate(D-aspartate) O-methyltransferase